MDIASESVMCHYPSLNESFMIRLVCHLTPLISMISPCIMHECERLIVCVCVCVCVCTRVCVHGCVCYVCICPTHHALIDLLAGGNVHVCSSRVDDRPPKGASPHQRVAGVQLGQGT